MESDKNIRDEKLQCDIYREGAKISALLSDKIKKLRKFKKLNNNLFNFLNSNFGLFIQLTPGIA